MENKMIEISTLFEKLFDVIEIKDNEYIFSDSSIELIKNLSVLCKETNLYKNNEQSDVIFSNMTASDVLTQIMIKIASAPTRLHMISSIILLIPIVEQKTSC